MPEAQIASQAESEFVNDYYQRSRKKNKTVRYMINGLNHIIMVKKVVNGCSFTN